MEQNKVAAPDVFEPKAIYGEGILTFDPDDIQGISEACRTLLCSEKVYLGNVKNNKVKFVQSWLGAINEN